jgi:tetratricopeptide (TPR) repeat protein
MSDSQQHSPVSSASLDVAARQALAAEARKRLSLGCELLEKFHRREAIPHFDFAVNHIELFDAHEQPVVFIRRGTAYADHVASKGHCCDKFKYLQSALDDFSIVLEVLEALAAQRAQAMLKRGSIYGQLVREDGSESDEEAWRRSIEDFTAVIGMTGSSAQQRVEAYNKRGIAYTMRQSDGDVDRAIADFTAIIRTPDAPAEYSASARTSRAGIYDERKAPGDVDAAIADLNVAIETFKDLDHRADDARAHRAQMCVDRQQPGDFEMAIADYNHLVNQNYPQGYEDELVGHLISRGYAYYVRGNAADIGHAIDDFSTAIVIDAYDEGTAHSLNYRGRCYLRRRHEGDIELALVDLAEAFDKLLPPSRRRRAPIGLE